MKRVLITGLTGQDGRWLAKRLLELGDHEVHAVVRRSAGGETGVAAIKEAARLGIDLDPVIRHEGDITDSAFLRSLLGEGQFDHVYNLAAQSSVAYSFDNPIDTMRVNALPVFDIINTLERLSPNTRLYQASTSEMFGGHGEHTEPQNESSPLAPQSPYGIAKVAAHHAVRIARDRGLFACAGILFNHESELRGVEFVSRKITRAVARIKLGLQKRLTLGNLEARRDWGYAPEYVEAMRLMIEADKPRDYVIGTGKAHTVRELLVIAWRAAALDPADMPIRVVTDDAFKRPNEVGRLRAEIWLAERELGWHPKTTLTELVERMVAHDLAMAREEDARRGAAMDANQGAD